MSYEMFRIYAPALNTVSSLEFVLCDEGHRIKGLDSKISLALNNCAAIRRVVMTGTPVQNNLTELFALVNFVVPGYLGEDLASFRTLYESASSAQELQSKLKVIMLRRTKEQILSKILPARHIRYVFADFGYGQSSIDNRQSVNYENCCEEARIGESNGNAIAGKMILLPIIMNARMICSGGVASETTNFQTVDVSKRAESLLRSSVKLRVLKQLLQNIRTCCPQDRIIIASNFLNTLDAVKVIATHQRWSSLRIDGSVSTDARHNILKLFNSNTFTASNEPLFPILLLATKAGGEGLNLVAANHMILMDIDWNPAVDTQTMGRIWRPGQQKEVFIYRLLISNSIEECILRRQQKKVSLHEQLFRALTNSLHIFLSSRISLYSLRYNILLKIVMGLRSMLWILWNSRQLLIVALMRPIQRRTPINSRHQLHLNQF